MKKRTLLIYCAGGFGTEVLSLAKAINREQSRWSQIYFVDDAIDQNHKNGIPIMSFNHIVEHYCKDTLEVIIANGEPLIKKEIHKRIQQYGLNEAILIHPKVDIFDHQFISIGSGVVISEGVILTSNIKIERGVILNINNTVGHGVRIGEFSTVSPGCNLSGNVTIGKEVYIGSGTSIKDEVSIGDNCIIGMGSVVLNDIESNSIAYGNPAKQIRENTNRRVFK
jgi:sugar O-acyltransferase (sialic acid O-acetyltransferase NeuD family)